MTEYIGTTKEKGFTVTTISRPLYLFADELKLKAAFVYAFACINTIPERPPIPFSESRYLSFFQPSQWAQAASQFTVPLPVPVQYPAPIPIQYPAPVPVRYPPPDPAPVNLNSESTSQSPPVYVSAPQKAKMDEGGFASQQQFQADTAQPSVRTQPHIEVKATIAHNIHEELKGKQRLKQ